VRQKLDERVRVGQPLPTSGKSQNFGARIGIKLCVDRVGSVVVSSNGAEIREGNANEKGKAPANQATNRRSARINGRHAAHLKVEGCQIAKAQNENGGLVVENMTREKSKYLYV